MKLSLTTTDLTKGDTITIGDIVLEVESEVNIPWWMRLLLTRKDNTVIFKVYKK